MNTQTRVEQGSIFGVLADDWHDRPMFGLVAGMGAIDHSNSVNIIDYNGREAFTRVCLQRYAL